MLSLFSYNFHLIYYLSFQKKCTSVLIISLQESTPVAREKFPRKFATDPQGHCDENNFPRKTLANLHQNSFLAKLQPICETFPQTHANPSQICDRSYRRKSVTNLQGICVRIAIPYMFVAIPSQKNR